MSESTEFNAQKIASWALVVAVGGLALVMMLVSIASTSAHNRSTVDQDAVNARIVPVASVQLASTAGAAKGTARSGEEIYTGACSACHAAGVAGAPKMGDNVAWAPRLSLGLDGLLKSALNGKNAMPPRGGSDASDVELARAIVHMANKAGGNLKEPAATK